MTNLRQAILIKLGSRHTPNGSVGSIRNVTLSDITAELADGEPDAGQPFRAPVPSYKHNRFPCIVSGLPGHPIENLTLRRVVYHTTGGGSSAVADLPLDKLSSIPEHAGSYPEYSMHGELPAYGWFIRHAQGINLESLEIDCQHPDTRSAIVCDDVAKMAVSGLQIKNPGVAGPLVALQNTREVSIRDSTVHSTPSAFVQLLDSLSTVKVTGTRSE